VFQTMLKLYIISAKCNHHINILFVPVVTKYALKVYAETNVGLVVNCLMNLDIWRNINPYDISPSREYPENILKELVFLYVAKLMQLYIGVCQKV
jgi:hypothetical protein